MKHSQQPSIDILKAGISKFEILSIDYPGTSYYENMVADLKAMLYHIESLPQEPTTGLSVESLLEKIPYMGYVKFVNMSTYWIAQTDYNSEAGKTPIEAILALKAKLALSLDNASDNK